MSTVLSPTNTKTTLHERSTDNERMSQSRAFVQVGLDKNEKILCLGTSATASEVREYLTAHGKDANNLETSGQLVFARGGVFLNSGKAGFMLSSSLEEAGRQGFSGLRMINDMSWARAELHLTDADVMRIIEIGEERVEV